MSKQSSRGTVCMLVALAIGCSNSTEGAAPVPQAEFCARFTEIICRGDQTCCTDATQRYASMEACVTAKTAECMAGASAPVFTDGRVRYDAAAAGVFVAMATPLVNACDVRIRDLDGSTLYVGTLAVGGDCSPVGMDFSPAFACMPGTHCAISGGPVFMGTCQAEAMVGGACMPGDDDCAHDLYCDTSGAMGTGTCQPEKPNGATCTFENECQSSACPSGTCVAATPHSANETFCTLPTSP